MTAATLVAGVDSSTQSTKVEVRDLVTGAVVASGSAPHPVVTPPCSEQDPRSWFAAFEAAWAQAGSPQVAAISVGGQQHGMVVLDADDQPVCRAKLWNDTESSDDAAWLIDQLGSPATWADAVGSVPVAAFTITKLSWLHRTHPDAWRRLARVVLPHDYLTHRLTGGFTTDRGDASGTGYWSPATESYRWDLLDLVDADVAWPEVVPEVLGSMDRAGLWNGAVVAPGSGDNMAAALGVGLGPGDAVMSFGTSGAVFATSSTPAADPSGAVAGFADATGRYLPLVCTSNATKVLDAVRRLLGVDHAEFDDLALAAEPGGPIVLPYFDGERTPYRPEATGMIDGMRTDVSRAQFARAAVDGVVCGLLDGLDALQAHAALDGRLVLVGGGAKSRAVQRVVAGLTAMDVVVSDAEQAVATGAAVQAAAVLEQCDHRAIQQRWGLGEGTVISGVDGGDVRLRYATLRDR
ncbi:xylulokinase [Ilumatobacter coccineus]|uniref:Xylulose kinase n=1 Tax=Ilumatobacter coccineus (strain NBRC 103263 / KCTC 29153 / YM16-304) TaxID=1313172 RepID=A0A6C7E2R5_ILUCY|nr:xylulokinase [Ilumatobacter coccineus]BAN02324.1 xylulokinase [Ilumatobacter coccineus YM16-304]